ncbi:MAG: glycosyltransferase family 4 protein [Geminicoccaceae bacterium]|nr:glycosyltransferase family 4 protein [Geminicoccaceae bacterium]
MSIPRAIPARRLVAINRYYRPDESATAQLLTGLLEHRADRGERVTVIAGRSLYAGQHTTLAPRDRLDGVEILRVWSTRFGRHVLPARIIDDLTFCASALLVLTGLLRRGDILLAKTDPPILPLMAMIAARLRGARLHVWCQDLFPETAIALGMTARIPMVGRILRGLRNLAIARAERIVVIGDGMAETLVRQGIEHERIAIAPNWAPETVMPVPAANNPLRRELGLQEMKIVGYSGNLGRAHAAAEVARLVEDSLGCRDLAWVFCGGGHGMQRIAALAHRLPCDRLKFLPHQPRAGLARSLSLPDMHLVSLDPACEGLVLPSKIYGIVAAGRPVLFLGDPLGPTARLIRELDLGIVLPVDRPNEALERLLSCLRGEITLPGESRLRAVHERLLGREHALARWSRILDGEPYRQPPEQRHAA